MAHTFRTLEDLELDLSTLDAVLPLGPSDILHGTFTNGMQYYVRPVAKPKHRASLALVVRIGSLVEEEEERGLAHVVEHLAFNATEKYSNHDLVKFLESIGAQFGPCQNAYTTCDETLYDLEVPTDDETFLKQAFSVFAEFATKIRCAPADLAKERGAVLEELRMQRDSMGRMQQAHWQLILKGSKYADRLPIGLEDVIRNASADTVRKFYEKWYRPHNMAVVVMGDFEDPAHVLDLLREQMESCQCRSSAPAPPIPQYQMEPHTVPRFKAFVDKEIQQNTVFISFQRPTVTVSTLNQYKDLLRDDLFEIALNRRLYRLSRQEEPPFYSAQCGTQAMTSTVTCFALTAAVAEGSEAIIKGFQALLTEVARVRLHGFSKREVDRARDMAMSDTEALYMEKDQVYAKEVRDEYVRHFLQGECVLGRDYEARLNKTLLPRVTTEEVSRQALLLKHDSSCVVKVVSHSRACTEEQLQAAMEEMNRAEAEGGIGPWTGAEAPEQLIAANEMPPPGGVTSRHDYPDLDARELILSNGMRVCYKKTDFLDDQVLLNGYALGALSQLPDKDLRTASLGVTLASELGMFGFKPEVLSDILSGKRCELKVGDGAFYRSFGGEQSPVDLEVAFQMIHKLFTTNVEAVPRELATVLQCLRESISSQQRNPSHRFSLRVRQVNYGDCFYFRPVTVRDVDRVDANAACAHFNSSFRNPAEFTVVLTGRLDDAAVEALACQYLASIPPCAVPRPVKPQEVVPLKFKFPDRVVRENIKAVMVAPKGQVIITFPTQIPLAGGWPVLGENQWLAFSCMLLETKLMQALRFKKGDVYTVSVSPSFSLEAPCNREGPLRGDVTVSFTCDPDSASRLIDAVLDTVRKLQEEGPSQEEIDIILTLEQRSFETQQYENQFWQDMIVTTYQSRLYQKEGNLDKVYKKRTDSRLEVRAAMSRENLLHALRRLLPYPCTARYTALALLPQDPLLKRVADTVGLLAPTRERSLTYWIVAASILALGTVATVKYISRR